MVSAVNDVSRMFIDLFYLSLGEIDNHTELVSLGTTQNKSGWIG